MANSDLAFLGFVKSPSPHAQVPNDAKGVPIGSWRNRAELMVAYHLAAVEFQLSQIHYAVNLAAALNRTLILPKVSETPSASLIPSMAPETKKLSIHWWNFLLAFKASK